MASRNKSGLAGPPLKRLCASVSKNQNSKIKYSYFRRPGSISSVITPVKPLRSPTTSASAKNKHLHLKSKELRCQAHRPKAKERPCFRGVLAEASKKTHDNQDQDNVICTAANKLNVKPKSSKMF